MTLDEFIQSVQIIMGEEARIIRGLFIEAFVDQEKELFKSYIKARREFKKGVPYNNYLWGVLKNKKRIGEGFSKATIGEHETVFVFWDTHNKVRGTREYLNFPEESVLKTSGQLLVENLDHLPEDIYVFDESFSWTVVLTHENGSWWDKRYCLFVTADNDRSKSVLN